MNLPEINRLKITMNERREGTVENMLVAAIEEELELEFEFEFVFATLLLLIQTHKQQVVALSSSSFSKVLTV